MIRSVDILDDQGNIITRRGYDSNGNIVAQLSRQKSKIFIMN